MILPTLSPSAWIRTAAAAVLLPLCAAATAQVQRCQVDGRPVFQSSPCALEARVAPTAALPPAPAAPTAGPKKKTLADLLRERDGGDAGNRRPREFQGDGASVLQPRMGAV